MYVRMCVEGYRWPGCTRNIHYILSSKVNMFPQPVLIFRGFPAGVAGPGMMMRWSSPPVQMLEMWES
jgi:hypothetical protein